MPPGRTDRRSTNQLVTTRFYKKRSFSCFFAFFSEFEPGDWWSRYLLYQSVGCDSLITTQLVVTRFIPRKMNFLGSVVSC